MDQSDKERISLLREGERAPILLAFGQLLRSVHCAAQLILSSWPGVPIPRHFPQDQQVEVQLSELAQMVKAIRALPDMEKALIANESSRPDAPIIILLGDEHGSPEREENRIRHLRARFGIKLVGLEGYAGKEAELLRRGFQIRNGEAELIEALLRQNDVAVVPLEEKELQERALFAVLGYNYLQFHKIKTLEKHGAATEKELEEFHVIYEANAAAALNSFGIDYFNEVEVARFLKQVAFPRLRIEGRELLWKTDETHFDSAQTFRSRLDEILARFEDDSDYYGDLVNKKRSSAAAALMAAALDDANEKIAIMVYGMMHTAPIVEALKAEDVSVIFIPVEIPF